MVRVPATRSFGYDHAIPHFKHGANFESECEHIIVTAHRKGVGPRGERRTGHEGTVREVGGVVYQEPLNVPPELILFCA